MVPCLQIWTLFSQIVLIELYRGRHGLGNGIAMELLITQIDSMRRAATEQAAYPDGKSVESQPVTLVICHVKVLGMMIYQ